MKVGVAVKVSVGVLASNVWAARSRSPTARWREIKYLFEIFIEPAAEGALQIQFSEPDYYSSPLFLLADFQVPLLHTRAGLNLDGVCPRAHFPALGIHSIPNIAVLPMFQVAGIKLGHFLARGIEELQGLHLPVLKIDQYRRNMPPQVVLCSKRKRCCQSERDNEKSREAAGKGESRIHP